MRIRASPDEIQELKKRFPNMKIKPLGEDQYKIKGINEAEVNVILHESAADDADDDPKPAATLPITAPVFAPHAVSQPVVQPVPQPVPQPAPEKTEKKENVQMTEPVVPATPEPVVPAKPATPSPYTSHLEEAFNLLLASARNTAKAELEAKTVELTQKIQSECQSAIAAASAIGKTLDQKAAELSKKLADQAGEAEKKIVALDAEQKLVAEKLLGLWNGMNALVHAVEVGLINFKKVLEEFARTK